MKNDRPPLDILFSAQSLFGGGPGCFTTVRALVEQSRLRQADRHSPSWPTNRTTDDRAWSGGSQTHDQKTGRRIGGRQAIAQTNNGWLWNKLQHHFAEENGGND